MAGAWPGVGRRAVCCPVGAGAFDFAMRSVTGGEDAVRFNPSDLNAWLFWVTGFRQVSDQQYEMGQIENARNTLHAMLALEQDRRRSSSLGPTIWYEWIPLAVLDAQAGNAAGAEAALKGYARDRGE